MIEVAVPVRAYGCAVVGSTDREHRVVVGGGADEHADLLALEIARRNAGVFERFPGEFERQSLLRVDPFDLERRHREELGVEALHLVEVSAAGLRVRDRGRDRPGRR